MGGNRGGLGGLVGEREHNIGDKGELAGSARVTAEIHFLELGAEPTKKVVRLSRPYIPTYILVCQNRNDPLNMPSFCCCKNVHCAFYFLCTCPV